MCTSCVLDAGEGKKASDPLELELRVVVTHHVDAEILCESNKCP